MTTEYTDHFRLNLPDFRMGPWHDLVNEDFVNIDELLFSLFQGVDTQVWTNNTLYKPGTTAIDPADNSYWVCIVQHTSALTGSFAADRAAHPTYWNRVVTGISPRGEWAHNTHYLPNDMVTSSPEHVIAFCITEHTSNASGTIRDDAAYWSFIADIGSVAVLAKNTGYTNNPTYTTKTNLQDTTDELYTRDASQQSAINSNASSISNFGPRITALESSDTTQTANIASNTSSITNLGTRMTTAENTNTTQDTRLTNVENGKIGDAPADGTIYGRKNNAWVPGGGGGGASVTISDTPPATPTAGNLWWESDTGLLFIYYDDGTSAQWVLAAPVADTTGFVQFNAAQALTTGQQSQARQNIYAAPLDAMACTGMQVNGSMEVSQELGTTGSSTAGASICDSWKLAKAGTMVVAAAQYTAAFFSGFSSYIGITVSTAQASLGAGDSLAIYQPIEGYRVSRLAWGTANAQPLSIGFWVAHHRTGTYSVAFQNGATNRTYVTTYTQNVADTPEYKTITIPGDTTGTWNVLNTIGMYLIFTMANGGTPVTLNTWTAGSGQVASGQVNGVGATSDVFRLTGVVVLPGIDLPNSSRAPFIMRPYDQELPLCQRYWACSNPQFPKGDPAAGSLAGYSVAVNTLQLGNWKHPVTMRAKPSVTLWYAGTQNNLRNTTTGATITGAGPVTTYYGNSDRGSILAATSIVVNTWCDFDMQWDARL